MHNSILFLFSREKNTITWLREPNGVVVFAHGAGVFYQGSGVFYQGSGSSPIPRLKFDP